ncbi:MAG: hypothetical protein H6806_05565 [Planctomycetes bacterium]|nr:hypothetical protein [Planctomycetota bacterium]MCB9829210.1 hypothetical protein [Planctomycetota bacterium]
MKKALLVAVALLGLGFAGCCGCGPSLPELPSLGCGCNDCGCNTGCNPCDPCGC